MKFYSKFVSNFFFLKFKMIFENKIYFQFNNINHSLNKLQIQSTLWTFSHWSKLKFIRNIYLAIYRFYLILTCNLLEIWSFYEFPKIVKITEPQNPSLFLPLYNFNRFNWNALIHHVKEMLGRRNVYLSSRFEACHARINPTLIAIREKKNFFRHFPA